MKKSVLSSLSVALFVGACILGLAGPASAATPCGYGSPAAAQATVDDPTPFPGSTITVTSGDCKFDAGSPVPVTFLGSNVGTPTASTLGGASITFTLPCTTPTGAATVDFSGTLAGAPSSSSVPINVQVGGQLCISGVTQAAPVAQAAPLAHTSAPAPLKVAGVALPFTGSQVIIPGILGGLAMLLLGGLLLVTTRRRRTSGATS